MSADAFLQRKLKDLQGPPLSVKNSTPACIIAIVTFDRAENICPYKLSFVYLDYRGTVILKHYNCCCCIWFVQTCGRIAFVLWVTRLLFYCQTKAKCGAALVITVAPVFLFLRTELTKVIDAYTSMMNTFY